MAVSPMMILFSIIFLIRVILTINDLWVQIKNSAGLSRLPSKPENCLLPMTRHTFFLDYEDLIHKFDINGKAVQVLSVRELVPYTIKDGILYQMRENPETEEWELHTCKLL
jgi:hypothetical protein